MHITHIHKDGRHTEIAITVDYFPDEGVDRIISFVARNCITNDNIDMAATIYSLPSFYSGIMAAF